MNKICFTANQDTNYVFHMLSVAKCGYDNKYGAGYRDRYPAEDLAVFRQNEELLTVRGGEHCGALFGLMVCQPACGHVSAKEYYSGLLQIGNDIKKGNIAEDVDESLVPHTDAIMKLSEIMIRHYDSYIEEIWPREKEKIKQYMPRLMDAFEQSSFTEKAEELVGCSLGSERFTAALVTSVEGGAEAIDISKEQDMFGIERGVEDAFYFIGHEFIIYLLFQALKDENAFCDFETWPYTEGLAEYYLKKIMGDIRFSDHKEHVELYERLAEEASLSAAELYRAALGTHLKLTSVR